MTIDEQLTKWQSGMAQEAALMRRLQDDFHTNFLAPLMAGPLGPMFTTLPEGPAPASLPVYRLRAPERAVSRDPWPIIAPSRRPDLMPV